MEGGDGLEGGAGKSPLGDITDTVEISPAGREAMAAMDASGGINETSSAEQAQELSPEEEEKAAELERRDTEVGAHEQARTAAERQGASAEVSMSVTPIEGDAEATARKMRAVRDAALAPTDPSGQDRVVAAKAVRELVKAQVQAESEIQEADAAQEPPEARSPDDPQQASAAGRRAYARSMFEFLQDPKGSILSLVG